MSVTTTSAPADGNLVSVCGKPWVVSKVDGAECSTLVSLQNVADSRDGDILQVTWEVERGANMPPIGTLPVRPGAARYRTRVGDLSWN